MERQLFAGEFETEQRELGPAAVERTGADKLEPVAIEFEKRAESVGEALPKRNSLRRWTEHELIVQVSLPKLHETTEPLSADIGLRAGVLPAFAKGTPRVFRVDHEIFENECLHFPTRTNFHTAAESSSFLPNFSIHLFGAVSDFPNRILEMLEEVFECVFRQFVNHD